MDQIQSSFGMIPSKLASLVQQLQREEILIDQGVPEVKKPPSHGIENRTFQSVHKALLDIFELYRLCQNTQEGLEPDLAHAAKLLEQIQMAVAQADRSAFICHLRKAIIAAHIAEKIATLAREFFHDIKDMDKKWHHRHAA